MSKFLGFFKSRWFIGTVGFLAIASLIWYLGPLIAVAGQTPLVVA